MSQAASPRPHLAAAADIEGWAETIMARADLARLVRNLIRQTNDQVTTLRMPGGEGSTIPGYDGVVVTARGTPFVPEGRSVWELGTGGEPTDKATEDYKKRKDDPLGEDQANTTFVFVTPRSWPNKQKWIDDRKADSPWKDIVVFDVHDIETALDAAPGAHYIFSDQIGKAAFGAQALLEWWNRFSASTNPRLTIEMVLAGREDQAAEVLKLLVPDVGRTAIVAASPDDALAFTAATILSSDEDQQLDLFGRAIIVHDSTVLRVLDRTAKLLILLPYDETMLREALLIQNHHVVFLAPPGTPGTVTLKPIDPEPMAGLLRKVGVEEGRARTLAQVASQSLVAFQNAAPARGIALHPQWATLFKSAIVRRAWLAGGWLELRSGDTDVMAQLLGQTLEAASAQLSEAASGEDPLFVVVASVWGVASPEASWEYLRPYLTRTDFADLEPVVQQVLGAVDPKLELPVDERWRAAIHGKTRIHSDNLRKGLATTLALLGTVGRSVQLGGGNSAQTWAESVVRKLLDRANEDQSGELWTSISDVLPLLAEAAPEQFLRATSKGLEGADPVLRKLFSDKDAAFTTSSAHPSLLWSLEGLARSPEHFALAMEALARLVEVDPGGRLGNRPDSTFIGVISPWFPQTSATPGARLAVLDSLRERHPGIAWRLTLGGLPGMLGAGSFNYEPRFRRWGPGNAPVPPQEYWQMVEGIVDDLFEMADKDPDRWPELIKRIPDLPLSRRQAVYERIRGLQIDGKLTSEQHEGIWKALDELAREHRASPDAKWVMPLDDIVAIEELAKRFEPKDALQRLRYLFDEQMPRLSDFGRHDFTEYDKVLAARRLEALQTILDAHGMAALLELRDSAKQPFAVGWTVGESGIEAGEVDILLDLGSDDLQRRNYAAGYVAGRYRKEGLAWVDDALRKLDGRAVEQGRLLQMVREFPDVWERAKSLGPEVEAAYWKEFVPGGHGSDFDLVNHAADKLIEFGRPAAAADFLALYSNNAQPERIAATMEAVLAAPAEEQQRLSPYDLQRLLEALRNANFDENRLAILEWRSFPGLGFDVPAPTLERLLARDPGFFVQTLSLCFKRADGAEEARPSPETARNAFHVLHEWQVVPGSAERNGEVDDVRLKAWLDGAFDLLAKNDRVAIGSQYIGHSFANAREDPDGTWPTRPIRDAIERLASEQVERGFANQIFNNRGVTTRGLTDGGRQERALAEKFDAWAVKIRDTWPRTAAVLRSVAESYRAQGQAEDEEAERFKQGLSPF